MNSQYLAKKVRLDVLEMLSKTKSSHIGSCYSIVDILSVLYDCILDVDKTNFYEMERDRFILSKGHATAALYSVLARKNFFPLDWLEEYNFNGAKLLGHCTKKGVPGVEFSTGSLGHGLSVGLGIAKAMKMDNLANNVYVLVGDGECNEGSIWEAALLAPQLKLDNLCLIVDYNKIQSFGFVSEVIELEPFADKWLSFGWEVYEIDGHNHQQLMETFNKPKQAFKPRVIIAHTIKGKGVSYMENNLKWHYSSPNSEEYQIALNEIEGIG